MISQERAHTHYQHSFPFKTSFYKPPSSPFSIAGKNTLQFMFCRLILPLIDALRCDAGSKEESGVMEGYFSSKLKRKDLENVNDDFSEFSLSSPARKIRRLDAELPPIIEEEECEIPSIFDHSVLEEKRLGCNFSGGIKIEELPNEFSNEEGAIVLFNPIKNTPLVHSPSSFSLSMSPDLLSELKRNHHPLWPSQSDSCKLDDESLESSDSGSSNGCRAVVLWFPSNHSASASASAADLPSQTINIEMMEEEEDAMESRMDVEDSTNTNEQMNVNESGGMSLSEDFNQWQQQHCVFPRPPQNAATPIVWYR